jgi:hypothetical protein
MVAGALLAAGPASAQVMRVANTTLQFPQNTSATYARAPQPGEPEREHLPRHLLARVVER